MRKHICIILSIAALLGTLNGCGQKAQTHTTAIADTTDTATTTETTSDSNTDKTEDATEANTEKKDITEKTTNTTTAAKTSSSDNATENNTESQNQNSNTQNQVTNLNSSNTQNSTINKTVSLPKDQQEARDSIVSNDSNYIASSTTTSPTSQLSADCSIGSISKYLTGHYSDVPAEDVYCFELTTSDGTNKWAECTYLVGKTSKNIYCRPNQGGLPMYQIKNNEKVKTFNSLDAAASNASWH